MTRPAFLPEPGAWVRGRRIAVERAQPQRLQIVETNVDLRRQLDADYPDTIPVPQPDTTMVDPDLVECSRAFTAYQAAVSKTVDALVTRGALFIAVLACCWGFAEWVLPRLPGVGQ